MNMIAFNGGIEGAKKQWSRLVEEAGFMLLHIWDPIEEGADAIVEAVLLVE